MKQFSEVTEESIQEEYINISKNIKEIRIEKSFTQEELALAMGFTTPTFYTNAENNKQGKHFNLEHIIKLSKIMNVPMSKFFI